MPYTYAMFDKQQVITPGAACASSSHWCNVSWYHTRDFNHFAIPLLQRLFFTPVPEESFSKGFMDELSLQFSLHTCLLPWPFWFMRSPAPAAKALLEPLLCHPPCSSACFQHIPLKRAFKDCSTSN